MQADNIPDHSTLAQIDRALGADLETRDRTEAEERADRLADPTRYGLCADHAREDGAEVGAAPGCDLCDVCLADKGADLAAIRERRDEWASWLPMTAAETRLRADYLRDVGAAVAEIAMLRRYAESADEDRRNLRARLAMRGAA